MFDCWLVNVGARYCALMVAKAANKTISYFKSKNRIIIHFSCVISNNLMKIFDVIKSFFGSKKVEKRADFWAICATFFWNYKSTPHLKYNINTLSIFLSRIFFWTLEWKIKSTQICSFDIIPFSPLLFYIKSSKL